MSRFKLETSRDVSLEDYTTYSRSTIHKTLSIINHLERSENPSVLQYNTS